MMFVFRDPFSASANISEIISRRFLFFFFLTRSAFIGPSNVSGERLKLRGGELELVVDGGVRTSAVRPLRAPPARSSLGASTPPADTSSSLCAGIADPT